MNINLIVLSPGPRQGAALAVHTSPFVIGRDSACHLLAMSLTVSSRHCAVTARGRRVYVRDLDSTNGTRVNDMLLVGETELRDRDQLAVGPLRFLVRIGTAVTDQTPLPPNKEQITLGQGSGGWDVQVGGEAKPATQESTEVEPSLGPHVVPNPGLVPDKTRPA